MRRQMHYSQSFVWAHPSSFTWLLTCRYTIWTKVLGHLPFSPTGTSYSMTSHSKSYKHICLELVTMSVLVCSKRFSWCRETCFLLSSQVATLLNLSNNWNSIMILIVKYRGAKPFFQMGKSSTCPLPMSDNSLQLLIQAKSGSYILTHYASPTKKSNIDRHWKIEQWYF